ncbi:alpha/beta fold hydrolase [Tessaracoccus antarcticus]|uniref:Alpha/beta fold hydrolase n=1 Tax=Tessaracoccus antarcticus TaxID=2479848 RepID=A0A3M0GCH7_9ACTN|nr:alpha/beta fold hydrolase [Tessaracoccus antarcticus]RMB58829.1 alpha/beta fold hydrolase [Tessaracoccus antarcticus]
MSLHHIVVGKGPERIVFIHGLFGQGKNFTSIATAISDVATSWLVDQPNHGRSPWTVDFTLDQQADLVADWLRVTVPGPATVVGHSLGGKVGMRLALRHPELVSRLMVVDTAPTHNEATSHFADLVSAMRNLDLAAVTSRSDADRRLADAVPDPGVRGFLLQNLKRRGGHWAWNANLDLLGDNLHVVAGWPAVDASWEGPTWWVVGGRSDYVTPEDMPAMRRLFPRVVSVTLKRAGHWVHADEPQAFTEILRKFLA